MKKLNSSKFVLAMAAAVAIAAPSIAKRATKAPIEVAQPDGTTLSIRLVGDEKSHLRLTEDGFPVLYDTQLGYVYAMPAADGSLAASSVVAHNAGMRNASELSLLARIPADAAEMLLMERENSTSSREKMATRGPGLHSTTFPSKGEQKGLVILVEYTDMKFGQVTSSNFKYSNYSNSSTPVYDYWHDMLNKNGFSAFGGTGSCRDWFIDNSKDADGNPQFVPEFDLFGPVALSHPMSYYGQNDSYDEDLYPHKMVIEACKALDSQVNFADYDRDGDGLVDNVYVFYAGYGEADGGPATCVWPHSWDLVKAGEDFELDGVTISHYACSNEVDFESKRPDGIGTFVHEFSHVMGLPDLYSTVYNTAYTPDAYSVMDYGPYNNNGCTPPNYSAYERYALDWMTPVTYGVSGEYTIPNLADSNMAYIVNTEKQNEYFLVENRQLEGWDKYIPGHGMLIWHIDFKPSIFDSNKVNNTPSHQYVDLIEANGRKNVNYASGHPFPGTDGVTSYAFKSWANKSTGISFENISESNGIIKKNVINLNVDGISEVEATTQGIPTYYNLQGVKVENPVHGQILIRIVNGAAEKIVY